MKLLTWVNGWASSQHWRQASGPGKKTPKRQGKVGWKQNLGQTWNTSLEISQGSSLCSLWWANLNHHDCRSCEFLVLLLFSLFTKNLVITIKLNSISQSDQSSWKTFCGSLCSDRNLISIPLLCGSANDSRRSMVVNQWLIHEIGRFAWKFQLQLMVNVPITICTAQLQARSTLCFVSLIKSLNFRSAWIFYSNILDILVFAKCWRPSHHLPCSTSGQISSLLYLSDKISELELGRIAWIFCRSLLTPQLEAQVFRTPVCSLVLLVSRQLIMVAASLVKLTSSSWIPQKAASARAAAPRQGAQALTRVLPSSSE